MWACEALNEQQAPTTFSKILERMQQKQKLYNQYDYMFFFFKYWTRYITIYKYIYTQRKKIPGILNNASVWWWDWFGRVKIFLILLIVLGAINKTHLPIPSCLVLESTEKAMSGKHRIQSDLWYWGNGYGRVVQVLEWTGLLITSPLVSTHCPAPGQLPASPCRQDPAAQQPEVENRQTLMKTRTRWHSLPSGEADEKG